MDPLDLLRKHYGQDSQAFRIIVVHSVLVAAKALELARALLERCPGAEIDLKLLEEAALLHDIGIKCCHAPEIHCTGVEPYIRHGIAGQLILESEGLPRHAPACSRHTGAGITAVEVLDQSLPLPPVDYLPVTLEEKLICVADKYYSKTPSKLWKEKSDQSILKAMGKHGPAALARWHQLRAEILGPG